MNNANTRVVVTKGKRKAKKRSPNSASLGAGAIRYPAFSRPYRVNIREGWTCPDEVRVCLPYSTNTPSTSAAGVPVSYLFRGNGAFDPDFTGAGAQPEGYDEWSNLFNNYRVLGSKITVRPVNVAVGLTWEEIVLCPIPGASPVSVVTGLDGLKASRFSKSTTVQTNVFTKLISSMSTAQILGKPEIAVESDDTLGAVTTTIPNVQWMWQISHVPVDLTTGETLRLMVLLEYDIVFWGRKNLALS